jgi:hypothetical protein
LNWIYFFPSQVKNLSKSCFESTCGLNGSTGSEGFATGASPPLKFQRRRLSPAEKVTLKSNQIKNTKLNSVKWIKYQM